MTHSPTTPSQPPKIHWPSVLQFGLSAVALLLLWGTTLTLLITAPFTTLSPQASNADATRSTMTIAGTALIGLLVLPSMVFSLARLLGKPIEIPPLGKPLRTTALIGLPLIFGLAVYLGYQATQSEGSTWLSLPPLHLLALGLPVLWILLIGTTGLKAGSPQRLWGTLASGMLLSSAIVLVLELLALLVALVMGGLFIALQPDLLAEVSNLIDQLSSLPIDSPMIDQLLTPYLMQPGLWLLVLAGISVVVPLIEEFIKPIGVWLLIGRKLSTQEGFVLGLISGAGFALTESLSSTLSDEGWALVASARLGTALMHVFTAGLVGAALADARREGQYLKLLLSYLGAVALHGLWNALALSLTGTFAGDNATPLPSGLVSVAPYGLVALALVVLGLLIFTNRRLRRQSENASVADPQSA
jgi:RsiW-degrading membrane proteinase PrsW (M82 family)